MYVTHTTPLPLSTHVYSTLSELQSFCKTNTAMCAGGCYSGYNMDVPASFLRCTFYLVNEICGNQSSGTLHGCGKRPGWLSFDTTTFRRLNMHMQTLKTHKVKRKRTSEPSRLGKWLPIVVQILLTKSWRYTRILSHFSLHDGHCLLHAQAPLTTERSRACVQKKSRQALSLCGVIESTYNTVLDVGPAGSV